MDLRLKDKVVLITAASRGLGAASAQRFAEEGARVAIVARHSDKLMALAQALIHDCRARILPIVGDVTHPGDVERMVQSTIDHWGRLDILVTNAGGPAAGKFLDLTIEQWEAAVQLSLLSVVRLCYAALPHMLQNDPPQRGSIVAITSLSVKQPVDNLMLSNSVRMAVIGLLKTLASELGPQGIRVNAIAPGWTRTERVEELMAARARANGTTPEEELKKQAAAIPFGRMGEPDEFADALVWLASPRASYVHGSVLPVDGGTIKASL
jgi:3-oxoacyl-[acyl-carrier protein] reductase